jgi:hypothetical protein
MTRHSRALEETAENEPSFRFPIHLFVVVSKRFRRI